MIIVAMIIVAIIIVAIIIVAMINSTISIIVAIVESNSNSYTE